MGPHTARKERDPVSVGLGFADRGSRAEQYSAVCGRTASFLSDLPTVSRQFAIDRTPLYRGHRERNSVFCALALIVIAIGGTACGPSRSKYGAGATNDPAAKRWAKALGGDGRATGLAIAVDTDGSTVVVGAFDGRLAIGEARLVSAGGQDAFVARFASDGTATWAKSFGGVGADRAVAVTIGADSTAYVAGDFAATALFAGETLSAAGASDGFVTAINADGVLEWTTHIPASGYASPSAIAISARREISVVGYFAGAMESGGRLVHSAGALDAFVAVFNRSGNLMWSRRIGGAGADLARAVAIGPAGEVAIAGSFTDEADVMGVPLVAPGGDSNAFVALLTSQGQPVWARSYGDAGADVAHALAFDGARHLYVAGSFSDRISFSDKHALEASGGPDGFVAKLTLAGDHVWSTRLGGRGADRVSAIAAGDEVVVFAGTFEDQLELAGTQLASRGAHDVVVAKLSDRGALIWVRGLGGRGPDALGGLAVGRDSRIAITGGFAGRAAIDDISVSAPGTAAAFAAQLAP